MSVIIQKLSLVFFTLFALLALPNIAIACSCASFNLEEYFKKADYVFLAEIIGGRILEQTRTEVVTERVPESAEYSIERRGQKKIEISFDPYENYKGDSSNLDFLYTPSDGPNCRILVTIGDSYVFFIGENGMVSRCGALRASFNLETKMELERLSKQHRESIRYNKSLNTDASDAGAG